MRQFVPTLALCSSALMIAACGSSSDNSYQPSEQDRLEENRLVWATYAGQSYSYNLNYSAFSPAAGLSHYIVIDGELMQSTAVSRTNQSPLEITIDEIFETIQRTIDSEGEVEVSYNTAYGFPESANIDSHPGAQDSGASYTITNFEVLSGELARIYEKQFAWQALDHDNYTFDFTIDCDDECSLSHGTNPASESGTTLVEGNSAKYTDSEEYGSSYRGLTIDYFFERMIEAERSGNFDITVNYHPTYFFPISATFTGRNGLPNEHYTLKNFSLDTVELQLSALRAARTSWNNNDFYGYVMDLHISCECQPQGKIEIEVTGNTVVRAYSEEADRELTEQEVANTPLTISQLLDWAEAGILDERHETNVTYSGLGTIYPSEISSDDVAPDTIDGDMYFRVENLSGIVPSQPL